MVGGTSAARRTGSSSPSTTRGLPLPYVIDPIALRTAGAAVAERGHDDLAGDRRDCAGPMIVLLLHVSVANGTAPTRARRAGRRSRTRARGARTPTCRQAVFHTRRDRRRRQYDGRRDDPGRRGGQAYIEVYKGADSTAAIATVDEREREQPQPDVPVSDDDDFADRDRRLQLGRIRASVTYPAWTDGCLRARRHARERGARWRSTTASWRRPGATGITTFAGSGEDPLSRWVGHTLALAPDSEQPDGRHDRAHPA